MFAGPAVSFSRRRLDGLFDNVIIGIIMFVANITLAIDERCGGDGVYRLVVFRLLVDFVNVR